MSSQHHREVVVCDGSQPFGAHLPDVMPVAFDDGVRLARGLTIGALFVRAAFLGEVATSLGYVPHTLGQTIDLSELWIVEVPTLWVSILSTEMFSTALLVADEVSRFATGDLFAARDGYELVQAIGPRLCRWLEYVVYDCDNEADAVPFRCFCERGT